MLNNSNMLTLTQYIKSKTIRERFCENCIFVESMEDAEVYAFHVSNGNYYNIIFESSILKDRFFSIIKTNRPDTSIINCNSNYERVSESLWESNGLVIYNNVHICKDDEILNIINDKKGIYVC